MDQSNTNEQIAEDESSALSRADQVRLAALNGFAAVKLRTVMGWHVFRRAPRSVRWTSYGLFALFLVWVLIIGGAYTRLLFGPVSIAGYAPRIVAAVEARLPDGYSLRASGAAITREDIGIGVSLSQVDVLDRSGRSLLTAPRVTVGFDILSIATGNLAPRTLAFVEPEVSLFNAQDEAGAEADAESSVTRPRLTASGIVTAAFAILNDGAGIEQLEIRNARLAAVGEGLRLEHVDARFFAEPRSATPSIITEIKGGRVEGEEWAMNGRFVLREDGGLSGELAFADLVPDYVVTKDGPVSTLFSVESPVSGQIAFATLANGKIADGRFDIIAGEGNIRIGKDRSFLLNEARMSGVWDPGRRTLRILPSRFIAGRSRAQLGGEIAFPDNRSMAFGTIPFGIGITDVQIASNENVAPIGLDAIVIDGVYDRGSRSARLERFDLIADRASVSMVGFYQHAAGSPGIGLRGEAAPMTLDTFKGLWPEGLAPGTRSWFMRQVKGGDISSATIELDLRPGILSSGKSINELDYDAVRVGFQIDGATIGYFRDMPAIRNAKLSGLWTYTRFEAELTGPDAYLEMASGRRIYLTGGSYRILDTFAQPQGRADIELRSVGSFPAHMELVDNDPFNVASSRNLDINALGGDAELRMTMALPLRDGLTLQDTGLAIDAKITDLGIPAATDKRIENGDVELTIRNGVMRVEGEGQIDSVTANIAVTEVLYGASAVSEQKLTLILDEKGRKALGLNFGEFVQGTFPVEVTELGDGRRRINADLKAVRLYQPAFGLDKPAGSPATFKAVIAPHGANGKSSLLTEMKLDGREIHIDGTAVVASGGDIQSLDLNNVRLQGDDSARVMARTTQSGALAIKIEASRFDMRRIIDNAKTGGISKGGATTKSRRLTVDAVIGSARGFNGEFLQGLEIELSLIGDEVGSLVMGGAFADKRRMSLQMARGRGGSLPELALTSDNSGRLLRWLDLYSRMRGGTFAMRARIGPGKEDASGKMQITRFAIDQDPSLSQLISQTNTLVEDPSWQEASSNAPSAGNVGFDELYVDFRRSGGRFNFADGVLRGPVVGGTFRGEVDFTAKRIAMDGTYVPLYAINNFFGRLPLLGPILGGRADEGLIGVNFSVRGNLNRPNLTVNPVSAVTPGIFRMIFGQSVPSSRSRSINQQSAPAAAAPDRFDPMSQGSQR